MLLLVFRSYAAETPRTSAQLFRNSFYKWRLPLQMHLLRLNGTKFSWTGFVWLGKPLKTEEKVGLG